MILALALSPSVDVTYELGELQPNAVNRVRRVTRVPGGKALNAARVAALAGADVHVLAPLGGDTGTWIASALAESGLSVAAIPLSRATRTCVAVVADDGSASSTDLYEPATPLDDGTWEAVERELDAAIARLRPSWLLVSGSLPPGCDPEAVARSLGRARAGGVRTVVDSSGAGLRALAPAADLVKVNRAEAADLLGSDHAPAEAAASLAARTGGGAIVTDGIRPGAATLKGERLTVRPPARAGRFPAGSGDAFLGALVAALAAGEPPAAAVDRATAAAEANAAVPGQGILG